MMKFKEQDYKSPTVNLAHIETLLRKLRLSREIASDKEVINIFTMINRYLQDEDAVCKVMYLLPISRDGIVPIAQGLFSPNEQIEKLAFDILRKLEQTEVGRHCIANLNYFFMLKYQSNKFKMDKQQQIVKS